MITLEKLLEVVKEKYPDVYFQKKRTMIKDDDSIFFSGDDFYFSEQDKIIVDDETYITIENNLINYCYVTNQDNRHFKNIIELKEHLDIETTWEDFVNYIKSNFDKNIYDYRIIEKSNIQDLDEEIQEIVFSKVEEEIEFLEKKLVFTMKNCIYTNNDDYDERNIIAENRSYIQMYNIINNLLK